MMEIAKDGFKDDYRPRKNECFGEKYELLVQRWINEDLNLGNEIVYHPYGYRGRVDFKWDSISAELELKRLVKTKYCDCAWLKSRIVDRFTDKNVRFRLAVVTEKKWGLIEEEYLRAENILVIETGQINSKLEEKQAKAKFIDGIIDLIIAECELEKSLREYGGYG